MTRTMAASLNRHQATITRFDLLARHAAEDLRTSRILQSKGKGHLKAERAYRSAQLHQAFRLAFEN